MNYLILHKGEAFFTNWFQKENHYMEGMIVFNFKTNSFTSDGIIWDEIKQDHL